MDKKEIYPPKRRRIVQGQEEVARDLLVQIYAVRVAHNEFRYIHCDLPRINEAIQVAKNCLEKGIEDNQGYRIIEGAFKTNIYYPLARFLARQNILSVEKKFYNPNPLLESALAEDNNISNAQLALELGANPSPALLYPIVRHNAIEHVYMCGVSKYAREADTARLRLLIGAGAQLNIRNKEENPLYCALVEARTNARELLNILLYHGADPKLHFTEDIRGIAGNTPLACAGQMLRTNPRNELYSALNNLLKNGHELRSHRMALYLFRVLNGCGYKVLNGQRVVERGRFVEEPLGINGTEFPLELCYHIVAMNYGPLKEGSYLRSLKSSNPNKPLNRKGEKRSSVFDRLPQDCLKRVHAALLS